MLLNEISRRYIYLSKQEEPCFSWQNSVISLFVNKHLTFFDFTYDIQSTEKKLDLKENVIKYPSDSPISTEILQNCIQKGIKNIELVEMVTNPLFWPQNKLLKNEMEGIKSLKCSPDNFINHTQNVVAVINNFGNVNFLAQNRCTYCNILNFTDAIKEIQAPYSLVELKDIDYVKEIIYKAATSAICWAPNLNDNNSCYFVTVQYSGDILCWSLICENDIKSTFCGKFKSNTEDNIEYVTWVPFNNEKILLICSNIAGQIFMYEFNLSCNTFKLHKEYIIWQHKDKMVAKFVHYYRLEERIVLLFSKNRHVIAQLIDEQLNIVTQNILPVNDQKIVSFLNLKNEFYLGTMNTKLYKLKLNVVTNSLNMSLHLIDTKENLQTYELIGFGISPHKTMFALALKDRKLLHRKESIKIDLVFFSNNNNCTYQLAKLIENPSQSFTHFWECIEILRFNIFKNRNIPEYDYNSLLVEGESNVYKLKVYYLILMFYITLTKSKIVSLSSLPNTDVNEIKEKILVTQAVKLVNNLKLELENKKQLDSFKSECFGGAKHFLFYFCNKYKKCITDFIEKKTVDLVNSDSEYTCQSCDNKLEGFLCAENAEHLNMFCSITFTPIEDGNYLQCNSCGITARGELCDETPMCVFCDKNFLYFDMII